MKKSRQRVETILLECEWDGMGMASDQSSSRQFSMSVDQPGLEHPGLLILKIVKKLLEICKKSNMIAISQN